MDALGRFHSEQLKNPTWKKIKVAEDLKPLPPSHLGAFQAALQSKHTVGLMVARNQYRLIAMFGSWPFSQQEGQGEQNRTPLVTASLSLFNHPHQRTPPLQPAGPADAPATRPRRKAMNSKTCSLSSRWSDFLI